MNGKAQAHMHGLLTRAVPTLFTLRARNTPRSTRVIASETKNDCGPTQRSKQETVGVTSLCQFTAMQLAQVTEGARTRARAGPPPPHAAPRPRAVR
eukprot:scaffold42369_cov69-Phaeocystis_antarctica.AAC.2